MTLLERKINLLTEAIRQLEEELPHLKTDWGRSIVAAKIGNLKIDLYETEKKQNVSKEG
jgi:hypothetical protein